jgi:holin-like protein
MRPLQGLAVLLLCQSAGELLARAFALPLPGPVLGMGLLGGLLALPGLGPALAPAVGAAAEALLAHLSLLFVPLGVGVIAHLGLLQAHGAALAFVLVASTAVGIAVTALVLQALWREAEGGVAVESGR